MYGRTTNRQFFGELIHTSKTKLRRREAMGPRDDEDPVAGSAARRLHTFLPRQRAANPFWLKRHNPDERVLLSARIAEVGFLLWFTLLPLTLLAEERPDMSSAAAVLERAIDARAFPGCAVAVGNADVVLWQAGFGRLDYEEGAAVDAHTLYDLASLTKVVGTTSVVFSLVRDGRLALNDPVIRWAPAFGSSGSGGRSDRNKVTIEHLLTHSSGLPSGRPFYRNSTGFDAILAAALSTPLEAAPGERSRYSDVGFMILGAVASQVGGQSLAHLERERIFKPLGMHETMRNPPATLRSRIAPTEKAPAGTSPDATAVIKGTRYIHGVVHDENARAAEGLTGHAGLFSSAYDMALFAGEALRALEGRSSVFPRELLRIAVVRRQLVRDSSRGLGWDTPSGRSSAGDLFSRRSFGHTGFTGTSLWIDPERRIYLVFLTNRVHPSRDNRQISAARRELADAVVRCIARGTSASGRHAPGR